MIHATQGHISEDNTLRAPAPLTATAGFHRKGPWHAPATAVASPSTSTASTEASNSAPPAMTSSFHAAAAAVVKEAPPPGAIMPEPPLRPKQQVPDADQNSKSSRPRPRPKLASVPHDSAKIPPPPLPPVLPPSSAITMAPILNGPLQPGARPEEVVTHLDEVERTMSVDLSD